MSGGHQERPNGETNHPGLHAKADSVAHSEQPVIDRPRNQHPARRNADGPFVDEHA
jgi:hypothetical protein